MSTERVLLEKSEKGAWGPLLRQYRLRAKLELWQLAEKTQRARSSLETYEYGYGQPSVAVLQAVAIACDCTDEETAALLATVPATRAYKERAPRPAPLPDPEPSKAWLRRQAALLAVPSPPLAEGVSMPVPSPSWADRLARMAKFAGYAQMMSLTEQECAEMLAFLARSSTPVATDPTIAYLQQALDEFGAPPSDVEQLRRSIHRVCDQWLDWTRKRQGSKVVEVSGLGEAS